MFSLHQSARLQSRVNSLSWNPEQAVQLAVCYANVPTAEIWDLRASMTPKFVCPPIIHPSIHPSVEPNLICGVLVCFVEIGGPSGACAGSGLVSVRLCSAAHFRRRLFVCACKLTHALYSHSLTLSFSLINALCADGWYATVGSVVCWNPETGTALCRLPSPPATNSYQAQWSPLLPSVYATGASTDGKVSVYSLNTTGPARQVPKWLHRPTGCSFG